MKDKRFFILILFMISILTGRIWANTQSGVAGICYALPDDEKEIIKFYPSPGASPLPTPQRVSLSMEFNGEGSAYRATDGKIYAFKNAYDSDSQPSSLYRIDPETGAVERVKSDLLPYSVEGAEFYIDPNSGEETLYVIAKEYHSKLYAFDPNNDWALKSGYPKDIHGDTTSLDSIAINPHTGEAYGTDDYNYDGRKPKLFTIDLSTGSATFLTRTQDIVDAEGLAYAADGNLYIENELNSHHRIYKINPSTGELTEAVNYDSISGDFEAISCNGGDANLILKAHEDVNVTEGDSGYKLLTLSLKLNRPVPSGQTVSIDYETSDITATAGSDYERAIGKITIPAGSDSGSVTLKIFGDTVLEDDETFSLNLSDGAGGLVIPDSNITITIIDDDQNDTEDKPFSCEGAFPGPLNSTQKKLDILSASIYGTRDHKLIAPGIKQGVQSDVLCDGEECGWSGTKAAKIDFDVDGNLGNGTRVLKNNVTIDGRSSHEQQFKKIYGFSGKTINLYGDLILRVKKKISYNSRCTINVKHGTVIIYTDLFEFDSGTTLNIDDDSRLIIIANTFDFNSGTSNSYNRADQFIVLAKDKLEIDSGGELKGLFYSDDKLNVRSGGEYIGAFTGADVDFNSNNTIHYDFNSVRDYCGGSGESFLKISGKIFEDVNGDNQTMKPIRGVKVKLYKDNGDNTINSSDTFITSTLTNEKGEYSFDVSDKGSYFVSVDSKTVSPTNGLNSGYSLNDVWAEQTYAPKGGLCVDGERGTVVRSSLGSCYGGRRGALSDDSSSPDKFEHVALVSLEDRNVTDVNFGFSFNVVTNVNDSSNLQGSFRQFIKNANAVKGANHMRFVPVVAKNESKWWKVKLSSALDVIEDDKTTIDGVAYSISDGVTVRDENGGSAGRGGERVGAGEDGVENSSDEKNLPLYFRKEFEIDANDKFASIGNGETNRGVLIIKSSDNKIKDISIFNAAWKNRENSDKGSAILIGGGDRNVIEANFIGARADGSDPGKGKRANNAVYHKAGYALITKNYVAHIHYTGIWASSKCDITYNHLYYPSYEPYGDGITYEDSNGDDISIKYNFIENAEAYGIEGWEAQSSVTIENNTLSSNGKGSSDPANGGENGGIRLYGDGNGVRFNVIKNHPGAGVVVASGKRNWISKNVFYGNGGLSIDIDQTHSSGNINGDGVNPNDGKILFSKPNKGMDYPIITLAKKLGNSLHIEGYVGKKSKKIGGVHTIEFYKVVDDGNSDAEAEKGDGKSLPHGKGKWYLGSCQSESDGTFDCDIQIPSFVSYEQGDLLTATATDSNKNTSEYGCMIDEKKVSLFIEDANVTEGNSGERNINFKITLSEAAGKEVSFYYKTSDLTAKVSDRDYKEIPSTKLVLEGNVTSYVISVPVYGDTKIENNETFELLLSNPSSNLILQKNGAIGTIINDDGDMKPFVCDDTMYMSSNSVDMPDKIKLFSIDTQTHPFNFIQIGEAYKDTYNALGYNPKDNFLYALFENTLLRIDRDGKVMELGVVEGLPNYQLYSGTFDSNGYYYVAGKYDDSDPNIYKVDIDSMRVVDTIVMKKRITVYDFAFDKDEKYLLTVNDSSKRFTKISVTDGNVTEIGPVHMNFTCGAAYRDVEGRFFVSDSSQGKFYEFDTDTGEKFYLSKSQVAHLNDGANCPNAHLVFTDYGDAPASYGEAKSYIVQSVKLGKNVDHDSEMLSGDDALGDDNRDEDDEDGVKIGGESLSNKVFYRNENYNLNVSVKGGGYLSGWIDLNRDGDFEDEGEEILKDKNITSTNFDFNFTVPNSAATGITYARFRFSTQKDLDSKESAKDGETEDYKIIIDKLDYNLSVSDVNVTEGNSGEDKSVKVTVSLSNKAPFISGGIKVKYQTRDDTAKAGIDYEPVRGELIFSGKEREKNVSITIHGNNLPEPDKRFIFLIKEAKTIRDTDIPINMEKEEGVITIINDDHSTFDVIDEDISNSSYRSGKGLRTKIVGKDFKLKVVNMLEDGSIINFYEPNPLIPTMPILLSLKEGNSTSVLRDIYGNPVVAVMIPGTSFSITNAHIKIDRAIKRARIRMKYIDLYSVFNKTKDPCVVTAVNQSDIKAMPRCMNDSSKYKDLFGERAYERCIMRHGSPCRADRRGRGEAPYDHAYGCYECTADALGNVIDSSDDFAVRPYKFDIDFSSLDTKAEDDFRLNVKALPWDSNNSSVSGYNELNGTSFKLDYNETKSGCFEGNMTFSSSLKFNDGNLSVLGRYDEIGKVKFHIEEIRGREFASVDSDDTNDSLRFIASSSKDMDFVADHFDLSWNLSQEGRGFTYYSDDLTHMGAKVNVNIKAKGKNSSKVMKNYKRGCYSKDVTLKINFDIDSNNTSDLTIKYLDYDDPGVLRSGGSFVPYSVDQNFTVTIDDSNFSDGEALKVYKVGFDRDDSNEMEPAILQINDMNATDTDGVSGYRSESDRKALFYYGRVNTVDHIEGVDPIMTKIYYEVYCKRCDRAKYQIDQNLTSVNSRFWYGNYKHSDASCGNINSAVSMKGTTIININPVFDANGTQEINMSNSNAPYADTIRLTPSSWLTFGGTSYREFSVTFLNPNTHWAGEGKLGHTVDEKSSFRKNRKIEW
ncbi:MAG: hypothetical protein GXO31_02590 [Epsilonproteobacteria bacterium]|nr:hypothetical protein [Campylobacterota bacterium]